MPVLREITTARQEAQAKRAKEKQVTRQSHPDLAIAAQNARIEFAKGRQLAHSVEVGIQEYDDLNWWEQEIHRKFHSGILKSAMVKANQAFGHGAGAVKSLSIEQMANVEVAWKGF